MGKCRVCGKTGWNTTVSIEEVREYMSNVNLNDYDLGGCEITDDDIEFVLVRANDSEYSLEDVIHECLLEIREVLDEGLDDEDLD